MKKLALVFGAGPGLGLSVARKFAKEGFDIVLSARNEESLKNMSEDIKELGVNCGYKVVDVSDEQNLIRVINEIKSEYGTPDCVVYNVGITSPDTDNLTAEDLVHHFKTDVAGAFTVLKEFADDKFAEKKGAILLTGGGLALYPADGFIPLSIDKAALRSLAYIFNQKYASKGIFVGTITVCGTINGNEYFSSDNIADMYWQMFEKRDKCEYAYQFPELAPKILYKGQPVEYGIFEENSGKYWGEVYSLMSK